VNKASDKNSKVDTDIMEKKVEVDREVCIGWEKLEEISRNHPVLALSLTKNEKGTK
jgi:hypothetical protein